jgi:hypothetical protein
MFQRKVKGSVELVKISFMGIRLDDDANDDVEVEKDDEEEAAEMYESLKEWGGLFTVLLPMLDMMGERGESRARVIKNSCTVL